MVDWFNEWAFHIHLLMAISWIGGSVFMFVLGVSLRDKEAQQKVYPYVGPIFGWFELAALIVLLLTGWIIGVKYNLFSLLFSGSGSEIEHAVNMKVVMVAVLTLVTIVHFVIAYKTNGKERTPLEQILSRSSSMLIFVLSLLIMHYAIVLRDIL